MEENEIKIVFPKSWNDITLKKYQNLQSYFESLKEEEEPQNLKVLSLLTETKEEDLRLLPTRIINEAVQSLNFLKELPNNTEERNYLLIDGERYYLTTMEEMTFGEWVDINQVLQSNKNDFASVLAIICRKQGEEYNQLYINQIFESRVEMFNEVDMNEIGRGITFCLGSWARLERLSQDSINQVKEEVRQFAKSIENSMKDGHCNQPFTFWQKRKLKRLMKSLDKI